MMQYVNLLGAHAQLLNLEVFTAAFFDAINVCQFEMRESGHYVNGQYFKGSRGDMEFTIALSDEDGYLDLPYWIQVKIDNANQESAIAIIDRIIQDEILPAGINIARINNFGKLNEERVDY